MGDLLAQPGELMNSHRRRKEDTLYATSMWIHISNVKKLIKREQNILCSIFAHKHVHLVGPTALAKIVTRATIMFLEANSSYF